MPTSARILVVDDERMNLELCSQHLQRSGYLVDLALGGPQAIEMTERLHYDVVLLDYMMPGMSGIDVLKTLRARHDPLELSVIMVTAVSESSRISEALDLGANDYITKPVDFHVAVARIRSQIANIRKGSSLQLAKERYSLAASGAQTGLWDWDLDRNEIYLCPVWRSLLGYAPEELTSHPDEWFSRVHPADRERLEQVIRTHIDDAANDLQCEYRLRRKDGAHRWMSLHGAAVRHADGRAYRLVGSQSDVTDRTTVDAVTELPNRVLFLDRLSAALDRHRSDPAAPFAVLRLNLDGLKLFNDSLGGSHGDRLLIAVAERLRATVSTWVQGACPDGAALVAHLHGDEFAVLLENLSCQCSADSVAQAIAAGMRPVFLQDGQEFHCTFSVGIALPQAHHTSADDLLRDAEIAMDTAKTQGHGKWTLFERSMKEEQRHRFQLENDLRKAIEESQFEVYYQPQVLLQTGRICGFEALVRWNHPAQGLISPAVFIPVAEETGMIDEIGLWVLREACRQFAAWNQQFPNRMPYDVAVNVSARQCRNPRFANEVAAILQETGLVPACLHLELTESMLMDEMSETIKVLEALKQLRVGLKIDDFGTGYSGLQYLAKLPFDTLKIDQSFVRQMHAGDQDSVELVRSILTLARGFKLEVIAEGIETPAQLELLMEMGCRFGQGYFFGRPASSHATESILTSLTLQLQQPTLPGYSALELFRNPEAFRTPEAIRSPEPLTNS